MPVATPRIVTVALLLVTLAIVNAAHAQSIRATGPHKHGNLTIFLIHGDSTLKGDYLTLQEAMDAGVVKVHETSNVNELAIENTGGKPVFIQSGDIVKGGKQDRCIGTDFTLAPDSGRVPIAAFCVEHGRWSQRGGESAAEFGSSSNAVVGRALKLAGNANYSSGGGQQQVWDEVKVAQDRLSSMAGERVAAQASPSSLQLTLENEKVRETVEKYVEALADAPQGQDDVIGYAAIVNGQFNCADVYGSHELFVKLWPKQLESLATEAAAESHRKGAADADGASITPASVVEQLEAAAEGRRSETVVNGSTVVVTTESDKTVSFESGTHEDTATVRRSVIAKD